MSRRIAIVGAGQAGLPLALSLQARGDEVTLISNRSPDEIRHGRVMSSQCMFGTSLAIEREFGLADWAHECPPVEGIGLTVPHPGQPGAKLIDWAARLERPAQAVDQRLKMPAWIERFRERGGRFVLQDAGIAELEELAATHDLTVVAAGKGEVTRLFERDAAKSPYEQPQRALALTYVKGMAPRTPYSRVCFNLIPGVGEYFVFPALTTSGGCEIMVFEGVPGGPLDCWADAKTPEQHLATSLRLLETFVPWEAERCRHVELSDDNGILAGRFAPTVRRPVGRLPSGAVVFGIADAVVVNDPITGQGSNNATKCFKVVHDAIVSHGGRPFDAAWMQATFDRYWDYAQHVTRWTNMLLAPPPEHILNLLGAAGACPPLAATIANNFDHPPGYFPWWADAAECERFIAMQMAKLAPLTDAAATAQAA
ncbi:styrene monooxygenase/indole monooxygenase family protein [Piscinibacter sp.]|uniref:styrene monooxygenase/indole monooxygenase family protein n=1 Tax=Piscinibacter sp. TaxID=1903157 RepID=UPI002CBDE1A8|nr:styrene monooxygenase/indole monooxygenase family protein [Albitalea sp.]HUG24203.1 styrene monooxygenase/indole monooxygenase family protein [Albitalea sp.]